MRRVLFSECDCNDLVYIPFGAEKGDCPHCHYGVLRREGFVEDKYNVKEGYICVNCGAMFVEAVPRNFKRIAVKKGLNYLRGRF